MRPDHSFFPVGGEEALMEGQGESGGGVKGGRRCEIIVGSGNELYSGSDVVLSVV